MAGIERVVAVEELAAVLGEADYVVSSLPATPASRHLLDATAFAAMRRDAVLVNVGRGNVVDDDALHRALLAGDIRAAVLDVFHEEPLPAGHPFWDTPGLYVTPHVAAFTPFEGIVGLFAENLARYLEGRALRGVVDLAAGY